MATEYFYGDGIIQARETFQTEDYTAYYLTSYIETKSGEDQEGYYVHVDSSGTQIYSSTIDRSVTNSNTGISADTGEDQTAIDFDGDGNIDQYRKDTWSREYDSRGNLSHMKYTAITKVDKNNDGSADNIQLSKVLYQNSSYKVANFYWDSNTDTVAPAELVVEINKDIDGDGTYDSTSKFSFLYTPSTLLSSMGDHVATIEDTYLMTGENLTA